MPDPLRDVQKFGQSVWQDDLSRGMIRSGQLQELVDHGLTGVTANPSIFEKAIGGGDDYDPALRELVERGVREAEDRYERLAIEDVQAAADLFRPVYERTVGHDGFVSFEVSPAVAHETGATVEEARRLHREIARPNVMIKVPGTPEGFPAVAELIHLGIPVNITLLFGLEAYQAGADAYMLGLERLLRRGGDPRQVAGVASFFLGRIDTAVDGRLASAAEAAPEPERRDRLLGLQGKVAVANAKVAYAQYQRMIDGPRWQALEVQGARRQRLLWASTGVKNPKYPKLHYVEPLIGRETVSTMPRETLAEFRRGGRVAETLPEGIDGALETMAAVEGAGISMRALANHLVEQGVNLFSRSLESLLQILEEKRRAAEHSPPASWPRTSERLRRDR
jgi:transaldolase / glucose-6-phosphate isomerase